MAMAGRGHLQLNGKGMVFPIIMKLSLFRCKRKDENMWICLHWTLNHGWGLVFFTVTKFTLSEAIKDIGWEKFSMDSTV
jgi:hypothetical protein